MSGSSTAEAVDMSDSAVDTGVVCRRFRRQSNCKRISGLSFDHLLGKVTDDADLGKFFLNLLRGLREGKLEHTAGHRRHSAKVLACRSGVALGAKDKSRIEAAHMRFLRSTLGVTRRDRLRNKDTRNQLQQDNIVEEIQRYQKQWKEHVLRMSPSRLPRQAFFYRPFGGRDVERPNPHNDPSNEEYVDSTANVSSLNTSLFDQGMFLIKQESLQQEKYKRQKFENIVKDKVFDIKDAEEPGPF
ncbi:hypothetical protein ANN_08356 [Periplaneta americana]|uniref:Uncharacterized protein n=1 Tax=Periplaneta americana TaxID=6978 RepID=A0ABQ8T172_PERAM|nr:hypothetical protein ANN_08356 [Periplaneta americana]